MFYEIDLKLDDFKNRTDAVLHHRQTYLLAHGHGWFCNLTNCGEQSCVYKDDKGNEYWDEDALQILDTDKRVHNAEENGRLEFRENSWWELEFFKEGTEHNEYLDLFPALDDSCIVDSPADAIDTLNWLMRDKEFKDELRKRLKGEQ